MAKIRPACDRHPNLQMIECWIETSNGKIPGYECAVPGCQCRHDGRRYLDTVKEAEEDSTLHKNRLAAARSAILRAINRWPQQ
jgi:hypothetical protein